MPNIVAPETVARTALKAGIEEEWKEEGYPVEDDKIHESLGTGGGVVAVYPIRSKPWSRDANVLDMELAVQFFCEYELEVNPEQRVPPDLIEEYAERFRKMLKDGQIDPATSECWYFQLTDLKYTPDPTGNISRFVANLICRGNNSTYM